MFNPEKELTKLLAQKSWNNSELFKSDHLKEIARESLYDFEQFMLIVKNAAPEETVPVMNTYAMHVNKLHDVRDAFEYASIHEQISVLESLLDKHGTDDLLKEWILVYRLVLSTLSNDLTLQETLDQSRDLYAEVKNPLARMRLEIVELTTYFKMGSVRNTLFLADKMRDNFSNIKPGYMKSALASRISLLIGLGKLYGEGDFEGAEDYFLAVNVNEATPDAVRASSYHALSDTKLVDNLTLCLEYNKQAILFAERAGLTSYKNVLEHEKTAFIKNIYGEIFDISEDTSEEEKIHQHIVRNQTTRALEMIEQMEVEGKTSLFLLYYKGKATKDLALLAKALIDFGIHGQANMLPVVQKDITSINNKEVSI
ncbi:AimR family lysis-lysogeny pheromone receptor [Bacillus sp. JCM 19041]|uniref:AimR family lysis-lysogeny pheromone receptor n=1 Tax=Bacillus sp. JCM 19041 TaxID=1460637 RepID=UPI0006D03494